MRKRPWLHGIGLLLVLGVLSPTGVRAADAGVSAPAGLLGRRWQWERFSAPGAADLFPPQPIRYWVEFLPDGALTVQSDCNKGHGRWTLTGTSVKLDAFVTTLMACPDGSLDGRFNQMLSEVSSLQLRGGVLSLRLPKKTGVVRFEAVTP